MFDMSRYLKLLEEDKNKVLKKCIDELNMGEPEDAFELLLSFRREVDPEAYADAVRIMCQDDVVDVKIDTLKKVFEGLSVYDVMTKEEIDAWNMLPQQVRVCQVVDKYCKGHGLPWQLENEAGGVPLHYETVEKDSIKIYMIDNDGLVEIIILQ